MKDRQNLRDANGKLLFYTEVSGERLDVRDANGNLLGFVENNKTRDANGNLLIDGSAPAILYQGPILL